MQGNLNINISAVAAHRFLNNVSSCDDCPSLPRNIVDLEYYYNDGDIMIGAFIEMFLRNENNNFCSNRFKSHGFQTFIAIKWIIDQINQDPTLLPDVKIGLYTLAACHAEIEKTVVAVTKPSTILPRLPSMPGKFPLVGVVGDHVPPLAVGTERGVRKVNKKVPIVSKYVVL